MRVKAKKVNQRTSVVPPTLGGRRGHIATISTCAHNHVLFKEQAAECLHLVRGVLNMRDDEVYGKISKYDILNNRRQLEEVPRLGRTHKLSDEDSFAKEMGGDTEGIADGEEENVGSRSSVKVEMETKGDNGDRKKRTGIKISLADVTTTMIPTAAAHDTDSEEEGQKNDIRVWKKSNKVGPRPSSDDRNMRSAKQIRNMRKKVSVTSKGKKATNQADLALAIVEGSLSTVEDIVDAYLTLYGGDGFRAVLSFRYDIDPRTMQISCVEKPLADKESFLSPQGIEADMFLGLTALHIACAFDQEQVLAYFLRYGSAVMLVQTPSKHSLLHTCAWFGTAAPMQMLVSQGADVSAENARLQQPLHLAEIKGQIICAKILISAGAELECSDERGNTPLHEAVTAGHYDCAQQLVNYDVDVNMANDVNGTPLHYASTVDIVTLLMMNGAQPDIEIDEPGARGKTAFSLFLLNMPEAINIIWTINLKSNGLSIGAKDLEVCYEYDHFLRGFQRNPATGEIGSLVDIVRVDQRDLLKHPVCESFLHMKWLLVRNFFRAYLVFYSVFLASLTCLIVLDFSPLAWNVRSDGKTITKLVCSIVTIICLIILGVKNIYLMVYNFGLYVRTMQNFIELLMIAFIAAFLALHQLDVAKDAVVHLAALSLFLSWFNFTLLQGKLPSGGIYINMVVGISKDVLKFLLLYTSTLIAFALCFHIVGNDHENFKDPLNSILCVLSMMVGELGFADGFTEEKIRYNGTTQIIYVLFLLLVSVIIMNLLVGLAISNIQAQFMSAGVYRLKMTVLLICMIEEVISLFKKICPCLFRNSQLFPYFLNIQGGGKADTLSVFVYPNETGNVVFVKDNMGNRRRTGFVLPPWIMVNTFKYLQRDGTGSATQVASDKRKLEDKLNKMSSEVRDMKKDLSNIKNDLQTVVSAIKRGNKS